MDNKTYYIFKINKSFQTMYDNKSYNLYTFLKNIEESSSLTLNDKYIIYSKLVKKIDTHKLNAIIYKNNINNVYYKKKENIHSIINKYEQSKIYINKTFIKIISNKNLCIFFENLKRMDENYFIIDFKNKNYFWFENLIEK